MSMQLASLLFASLAVSLVSFSGGLLAILRAEHVMRIAHFIVSFAIGALLGVSLLELIPEAVEMSTLEVVLPSVLGGILLFFILEKFLLWYHCHEGECPVHTYTYLILWGDLLHNFVDGIILAFAFLADFRLGMITTLAVILHEIPQEIGDFGILIHGGMERRKAFFYNFLVALSIVPGAVLTYWFGSMLEPILPYALALIAGSFIYLASTDLMPELHERTSARHALTQIAFIGLGILLVMAPKFFFSHE